MPDLSQALQGNDFGFFTIISELWGLDLQAEDVDSAVDELVEKLSNHDLILEIYNTLPATSKNALNELLLNKGRMLWALFTRKHGELRIMGRARRDRDKPYLKPVSATEVLWYRIMISKAFLDLDGEPQEYAYIPDEFFTLLNPDKDKEFKPLGRPASPAEYSVIHLASDQILDHTCTLLAALRSNIPAHQINHSGWRYSIDTLKKLMRVCGLIKDDLPVPDTTRQFLEKSRSEALAFLVQKWLTSPVFNELRLVPGLSFEGQWENNPLNARNRFIEFISTIPEKKWWNLNSFISAIKDCCPDYQRPAGDYDSWFILNKHTNQYLRGFSSWDEVDGAYLGFMITGPLYWFGLVDLAQSSNSASVTAFRSSAWANALWHGRPPEGLPEENQPLKLFSDGRLLLHQHTSRVARYQIARFCAWEKETSDGYMYRVTPGSLTAAAKQDLKVPQLIMLIKKYAAQPVSPALLRALDHWEKHGSAAEIKPVFLLKIINPEAKHILMNSNLKKAILEQYNDTTFSIDPKQAARIRSVLAEAGYLCDIDVTVEG